VKGGSYSLWYLFRHGPGPVPTYGGLPPVDPLPHPGVKRVQHRRGARRAAEIKKNKWVQTPYLSLPHSPKVPGAVRAGG
jgi:hypothetical protein